MTNTPEPKPRSVPPSAAAHALAELGRRCGWLTLSRAVGVSEALLRAIAKSQRRASPDLRSKLLAHGIELAAWEAPPGSDGPSPSPSGASRANGTPDVPLAPPACPVVPEAITEGADVSTVGEAEENVRRLRRACRKAEADPLVSARDQAALGSAMDRAVRQLSRLRGEDDVTELQLSRSEVFQRLKRDLVEGLRPIPGALEVVVRVCERFE